MKGNTLTKCADERHTLAFLGMAAPISKDYDDTAASALFKQLIDASDYTHESFADAAGVSPGRVSQWATNRGSVPWDKARLVAEKLGTKPALISPAFRRLRDEFLASHLERLDSEIVSASEGAAKKLAGLAPSQKLDFAKHADAIAEAIGLTLKVAIERSEGGHDESTQRDGKDRRINRVKGASEGGGEEEASANQPRKRAAGGSGRS